MTIMTTTQTGRLAEIEAEIEQAKHGLATHYSRIGTLLGEVRDSKLYMEKFTTFESYVSERWGISRPRAYQLIEAANTAQNVSKILDIPTDAAARELGKLAPKEQKKAAKILRDSGEKVTAKSAKAAVEKVTPRKNQPKPSKPDPEPDGMRTPRGGLFASVKASEPDAKPEKPEANGHHVNGNGHAKAEPKSEYPLLTPEVRLQAAQMVQAWYDREAKNLNKKTTPQQMVEKIVQLFNGGAQ